MQRRQVTTGRRARAPRTLARLGALACAGAVIAACGSSPSTSAKSTSGSSKTTSSAPASPVTVKVEVYAGSFYTWLPYIANAEGFFAKNNINAQIVPVTGGGPVAYAALAGGSADVAMGTISLGGPYIEKGVGLSVISGAVDSGWQLVAPPSATVPSSFPASVSWLKNKPVGVVSLGSSSYYFLQQLLVSAGLGKTGVSYTALGGVPTNAVAALQGGRVAAAMVTPETAYYLETVAHYKLVFNFATQSALQSAGKLLGSVVGTTGGWMFATDSWMSAHPAAVKGFQLAMDEADVWSHNPTNLKKFVTDLQTESNIPAFAKGAQADTFVKAMSSKIVAYIPSGSVAKFANFWYKAGLLKQHLTAKKISSPTIPTSAAAVLKAVKAAGEGSLGSSA